MKLRTKQKILLFIILFSHVTLLDFAFIGGRGNLVFLWQQSFALETILVHLAIATVSLLSFILFNKLYLKLKPQFKLTNHGLIGQIANFAGVGALFYLGVQLL